MTEMNLEKSRFCGPFTKKVKNKKKWKIQDIQDIFIKTN